MLEGSYNTDLGLITIDKDKKLVGFEGVGYIRFKEDVDKMKKEILSDYFGAGATKNELKENEAVVEISKSSNENLFMKYHGLIVIRQKKLTP